MAVLQSLQSKNLKNLPAYPRKQLMSREGEEFTACGPATKLAKAPAPETPPAPQEPAKATCKQEGKATRRPRGRKSKPSPKEAEETPGSVATVVRTEQAEPVTLDSIKLLLKEMMKENMPKSSPSVPPVSDTNKDLSKEQPKVENGTVPSSAGKESDANDLSGIQQSNLLLQAEVAKLRQSISEAQPVLAKVLRVTQSGNNLVSGSNEMQFATTSSKQQRQQLLEELASPQPHSSSNILQYHLTVEQQMLQQQQYYNQQVLEHQHKQARVQLLKQLLFLLLVIIKLAHQFDLVKF
eukprot:g22205.t1